MISSWVATIYLKLFTFGIFKDQKKVNRLAFLMQQSEVFAHFMTAGSWVSPLNSKIRKSTCIQVRIQAKGRRAKKLKQRAREEEWVKKLRFGYFSCKFLWVVSWLTVTVL